MTEPADLLVLKYGELQLLPVGDLTVRLPSGAEQSLAFYAARVEVKNNVPYNLLIVAVPLALDEQRGKSGPARLAELPWVSVYLRTYFELAKVKEMIPLAWDFLAQTPAQLPSNQPLPGGYWLKEAHKLKDRRKLYTFVNYPNYLVTLESRTTERAVGTNLRPEYEFDLLLTHGPFNVAIERVA